MREALLHSLAMLRSLRLIALHLLGNAILLLGASFWLLIPEAHMSQLLFAVGSALLILVVFLWIHSGTIAYAVAPAPENCRGAFFPKIGRLLWLLIGLFVLIACMYTVSDWADSRWQLAGYLYSKAPALLRPTAGSSAYASVLEAVLFVVEWYLLPCILLPFILSNVTGGSTLRDLKTLGRWQYWLGMAILILLGVGAAGSLIGWKPGGTLAQQTVSLVARLLLAYLVATFAWLMTVGWVSYFVGPPSATDAALAGAYSEARSIGRYCGAVIWDWRLLALQLVGCVVMAAVSDVGSFGDHPWQIVVGVVMGLLLLIAFLWLHSGTLRYAANPAPTNFRAAFHFRWRSIGWLFLGALTFVVAAVALMALLGTIYTRGSVAWFDRATDVLTLFVVPCLLLPWIMAKVGREGEFRLGLNAIRRWEYWVSMAVVAFLAQLISDWLPVWHLESKALPRQVLLSLKVSVSYFPYAIGWILIAGLLAYFVGSGEHSGASDVRGQTAS